MTKWAAILIYLFFSLFLWAAEQDTVHGSQISILTWNIKMLPRIAFYLHHHPVKRARIIPDMVIKESPDVVVFQESYDGKAVRLLRKKLKAEYPYYEGFQNRKMVTYKQAGGVLIFSKYPLKEIESIRYSWLEGINKKARKGAMLVEVEHPAGPFQVLGTHMEAGGSAELKVSQYKEAGALLKRHEQVGIRQFASGDFNTHLTDTLLYPQLINALDAQDGDICTELKCSSDHLLNDMQNYRPDKRSLIDYVFYRPNGAAPGVTTRSVLRFTQPWNKKHKDLSDHFAVLLKMQP